MGNMEVLTIDFFKVVGDITQQFFKLDKLFKRFEMKGGGRQHPGQHALFKTYNINNVEATPVTLLSPWIDHPPLQPYYKSSYINISTTHVGGSGLPHKQQSPHNGHGQVGHLPPVVILLFRPYQYTKTSSYIEFLITVLTQMCMSEPSTLS